MSYRPNRPAQLYATEFATSTLKSATKAVALGPAAIDEKMMQLEQEIIEMEESVSGGDRFTQQEIAERGLAMQFIQLLSEIQRNC